MKNLGVFPKVRFLQILFIALCMQCLHERISAAGESNAGSLGPIQTGTVVYYTDDFQEGPQSSSQPLETRRWVGTVKRVKKNEEAIISPFSRNGLSYSGPRVFRPVSELAEEVNELNGFSKDLIVSLKVELSSRGVIRRLFSNGIAEIEWIKISSEKVLSALDYLSTADLNVNEELAEHPLGLNMNQNVYFTQIDSPCTNLPLPLALSRHHLTGRIQKFYHLGADPKAQKIDVQIVQTDGLPQISTVQTTAGELSPEIPSLMYGNAHFNPGQRVGYSSDLGIRAFHFEGRIKRLFRNGIAEVLWETENQKQVDRPAKYIPVAQLIHPNFQVNPTLRAHAENILEDDEERDEYQYLALTSKERALTNANFEYLQELDRALRERANAICIQKGFKGLLSQPKTIPLTHGNTKTMTTVEQNDFKNVLIPRVRPWTFSKFSLSDEDRDACLMTSIVGIGLYLLADSAVRSYTGQETADQAIAYLNKTGKKPHKHYYGLGYAKVPHLIFSELVCTRNSDNIFSPFTEEAQNPALPLVVRN